LEKLYFTFPIIKIMLVFLLFIVLLVGLGVLLSRQMNRHMDEDILDDDFREKDRNRDKKSPDKVLAFGPKMQWIAVKTDYREQVAATLKLTNLELVNWSNGLEKASENDVFLTPNIDGWILAVGWGLGAVEKQAQLLEKLSREYGEAQFFLTHGGAHSHAYIRYANGKMTRHFHSEEGEILTNEGTPTKAESTLDLTNSLPDENLIFNIATEWSVNPKSLHQAQYAEVEGLGSVGYLRP